MICKDCKKWYMGVMVKGRCGTCDFNHYRKISIAVQLTIGAVIGTVIYFTFLR